MPCALAPAIRCDFDVVSSGLPPPFPSLRCLRSLPLLSQDCVLSSFGSVSFASAIPDLCFSIFSLQPSSLFDPSPCIYPAGAYCFLRKVRDSNPRIIDDLLLSRELPYHSANLPLVLYLAVFPQGHCGLISLSRPSLMSLFILCFGYAHDRDSFTVPSVNTILTFSLGSSSPCLRSHSGVNILNCLHTSSGDSHTSSAPSSTSIIVCLAVAIISALSILSIVKILNVRNEGKNSLFYALCI